MSTTQFSGEITVASRIVDQLSSGLYESPAACLKELVNNSFDADAVHVEVLIKPDADRIIIEDNGVGMSKAEFIKHFSKISESYKREDGDVTPGGRRKIGKIGIGFIAANEICDTMEIFSTKVGSRELLHVEIHFDKMRQDPAERRRKDAVAKGDYTGELLTAEKDAHYTQVVLKRVRENAKALFVGEGNRILSQTPRTLYGLTVEGACQQLMDPTLSSWSEFDSYSQNLLRVALNVPVQYCDMWAPEQLHKFVARFEKAVRELNFDVVYDGTPLRKPTVFRPPDDKGSLIVPFKFAGEHVGAEGYFYVQHGVIRPRELHGLLVRIRQAAVGEYDSSFWGFPPSEGSIIQRWVSAEVWADDRLEEALNIDRKTLRIAHPAYVELQNALHVHLANVISAARSSLYDAGSDQRKAVRTKATVDDITEFATESLRPLSATAATAVISSWRKAPRNQGLSKALLRKFSVVELYRLVLSVAEETLPPDLVGKFVKKLTERLTH